MLALGVVELDIDRPQHAWGSGAKAFLEQMQNQCGWVFSWQAFDKSERPKRNESWLNFPLLFENNDIGVERLDDAHTHKNTPHTRTHTPTFDAHQIKSLHRLCCALACRKTRNAVR